MGFAAARERWAFIGLLSLAIVARLVCWAVRPDFWGDESALAMNISPKSLSEIGRPFVFWQICPWLFLIVAKLLTIIFGDNEHALRLLPLLGGLAVPPLAYVGAALIAGRRAGLFALALTAISPRLLYYSAELKPYSTDAALSAAAIALTIAIIKHPSDRRLQAGLLLLGAVGVWMSLPLIFVLGGCAAALGIGELLTARRPLAIALIALASLVWCGGFYFHLTEFISKGSIAGSSGVADFWVDGFMPFPPASLADLRWLPGKFFWTFYDPGGFHRLLRYPAGLIFLYGCYLSWKRQRIMFAACIAPLLLLVAASALQQYPMIERLILFAVPILMLMLAVAFDAFAARSFNAAIVMLLLLHVYPLQTILPRMAPRTAPGIGEFAERLAREPREGDGIYIDDTSKAAYLFYSWRDPPAVQPIDTESIGLIDAVIGSEHPYLDQLEPLFGKERVYVLLSTFAIPRETVHWDDYITDYLDRRGGFRIEEVRSPDYLFAVYDLSDAR